MFTLDDKEPGFDSRRGQDFILLHRRQFGRDWTGTWRWPVSCI